MAPVEVSPVAEQAQDAAAGPSEQLSAQAAAPAAEPVQDAAAASSVAPVQQPLQEPQQQRRGLRAGLQTVRQQWPRVAAVWRRAYWVDFILSLKVLPLQVGCRKWRHRFWMLTGIAWAAACQSGMPWQPQQVAACCQMLGHSPSTGPCVSAAEW